MYFGRFNVLTRLFDTHLPLSCLPTNESFQTLAYAIKVAKLARAVSWTNSGVYLGSAPIINGKNDYLQGNTNVSESVLRKLPNLPTRVGEKGRSQLWLQRHQRSFFCVWPLSCPEHRHSSRRATLRWRMLRQIWTIIELVKNTAPLLSAGSKSMPAR